MCPTQGSGGGWVGPPGQEAPVNMAIMMIMMMLVMLGLEGLFRGGWNWYVGRGLLWGVMLGVWEDVSCIG